jgi:hypothetical protein
MKALNLDVLSREVRTITLGGLDHEVIDMTVEDFIETSRAIDELEKDTSVTSQLESSIAMICRRVPTLTPEQLKKLSLEKLTLILKFIKGDMDDEKTEQTAQEAGDQEKK